MPGWPTPQLGCGKRLLTLAGAVACLAPQVMPGIAEGQTLPFLPQLRGDFVSVHYTHGSLDRAVHLQRRYEPLARNFGVWSRGSGELAVVVLSREEWLGSGLRDPYGLPGRLGSFLAIAAWADRESVALWKRLLGRPLPELPGAPIRGTPEEAASLFLGDLLGEVEAARLLIQSSVYSGREAWVSEVMAQVVARSTLARDPSNVLGELERLFARLGQSNGQTGLQSLDRFPATRDPQERLWFQARFFEAARLLSGNDQGQAAKKLFKRMRKRGGQMTSADLLEWYPVLSDWLEQRFGRQQTVNR